MSAGDSGDTRLLAYCGTSVPAERRMSPRPEARTALYTRREVGKLALAAVPFGRTLFQRPDSKFGGVQIGLNVPYSFGSNTLSAQETLDRCVKLGMSAVELRSQPVEGFLGVPADLVTAATAGGRNPTPEQQAARKTALEGLRKWRVSAPMSKVPEFRKLYDDAGVKVEILKFDAIYARADDELDYCFELAKALGVRAISCDISVKDT